MEGSTRTEIIIQLISTLIVGGVVLLYKYLPRLAHKTDKETVMVKCKSFLEGYDDFNVRCVKNILISHMDKQHSKEEIHRAITIENLSHKNAALFLIGNTSFDLLISGRFHIYRGRLSPEGNGLYRLFNDAYKELVKENLLSKDDYDETLSELNTEIKEIA